MNFITNISATRFQFNGVNYLKNYITRVAGSRLEIFNCYERADVLLPLTPYNEITVNGNTYGSAASLQSGLLDILYQRNSLEGDDPVPVNQNNTGQVLTYYWFFQDAPTEAIATIFINEHITFAVSEIQAVNLFRFQYFKDGSYYNYVFAFIGGKGTWGSGSNPVTMNQLKFISINPVTTEDIFEDDITYILPLGEIMNKSFFLATANSHGGDFSNSGKSYYFSYYVEDILYFALFTGEPGIYGTQAGNPFLETDFAQVTNSEVPPVIEQNNTGLWRNFNFILDNGDELDINNLEVAEYFNNRANFINISETTTPVIFEFRKYVQGSMQRYLFIFLRGKGQWGAVENGGMEVYPQNFLPLPVVRVVWQDIESDPNTVTVSLGEVAPENFLEAANADECDFTDTDNIYYLVYASEGVDYSMRFVGAPGVYGGDGPNAGDFSESDFVAGPTSETPPEIIPTLAQVSAQGNQSEMALVVSGASGKLFHESDRLMFRRPDHEDAEFHTDPDTQQPEKLIARMKDITGATEQNMRNVQYPADFQYRPFSIFEQNGIYYPSISNRDLVKSKINDMLPYYVGYPGSSDSNNGLSKAASFATISHAYALGARLIYVGAGTLSEGNFGIIQNATFTDLFIIGEGTNKTFITTKASEAPVWSLVSGMMYSATVTDGIRVLDTLYADSYGFPLDLDNVWSQALCLATPNSKYIDTVTATVYIHLADGRVPDSNVAVLKNIVNCQYRSNAGYLYVEGITFMGGEGVFTTMRRNGNPTTFHALFNNCQFLYGGGLNGGTGTGEGVICTDTPLSWMENCVAYCNNRDGFNYVGISPLGFTIEVNCQAYLNGKGHTQSIMNGSSTHNGRPALRINGAYFSNYGPNVIDVQNNLNDPNGSPSVCYGVTAYDSRPVPGSPIFAFPPISDFVFMGNGRKGYLIACKSLTESVSFSNKDNYTGIPDGSIIIDKATYFKGIYEGNVYFQEYLPGNKPTYQYPGLSNYVSKPAYLPDNTIVEYPEIAYLQSPTWAAGAAPSGILTATWQGTKIGRYVCFRINLSYSVAGSGLSSVRIPMPSGLPVPSAVSGYLGVNDNISSCQGAMYTVVTASPPATRASFKKNGAGGYEIFLMGSSSAFIGAFAIVSYWTD
ncbi:hypothetical protein [uncultured Flavobacterium sp.]|uniref:hypothetical protein n=1 Tax=uncultured Flavobacterium sp. TaxID=165435 RepID=UPI0025F54DE3|nr:hypothetical protein [uncultured Flavobacterium sp.]